MFPNIFSSMITVTIQVTSTLQSMNQWNLCFSILMVFTERESVDLPLALFRMRGGSESCLLVSCNTFSFKPFLTKLQIFRIIPNTSLKLLNLNQDCLSKKSVFLVKSVWIWIYDNFSHKSAKLIKICSCDHMYYIIWAAW